MASDVMVLRQRLFLIPGNPTHLEISYLHPKKVKQSDARACGNRPPARQKTERMLSYDHVATHSLVIAQTTGNDTPRLGPGVEPRTCSGTINSDLFWCGKRLHNFWAVDV